MASPSTQDLTGFFKEIYADSLIDLIPESTILAKEVPFEGRDKDLGGKYHQAVLVAEEGGFTYAASGAGSFSLNAASTLKTQDAQIDGVSLVLQSNLDYESAARASNSKKAFAEITGVKVKNMLTSIKKRLEASMWYGQSGIGKLNAAPTGASTQAICVISSATHAPMLWAGKINSRVHVYNGVTKMYGDFTITSVDVTDAVRTVTLTEVTGGDAALLRTNGVAGWDLFYAGSYGTADMFGIDKICTAGAAYFNIDPTVYDLWKSNTFAAGGAALTFKTVMDSVAQLVNRGLDEDVTVFVHPKTWSNLLTDQAALRQFDGSYDPSKVQQGAKAIEFFGMNGKVTVRGTGYVKGGEAFVLPTKRLSRVGASDVSFTTPGARNDEIFFHDPANAGFYFRAYSHQAIFLESPAKALKITGIVNS
jgi:hypothetical protein